MNVAHASCIFQNKIWLVGGHSDLYPTYNLQFNDKTADVWFSTDAGTKSKQYSLHITYCLYFKKLIGSK